MAPAVEARRLGPQTTPAANAPKLSGLRVLILEDDYYIAMEAKSVLEEAGADVVGPFSSFEQIERALAEQLRPDCAVVDINLGEGPSFAAARCFQDAGIPFLFLTGYGPESISAEFEHIGQTRKPARAQDLVRAVRGLCG